MVKLLLKEDYVQVNQVTNKGTALHIAAKNGNIDMVQLLIDNGADVR